MKRLPDALRLLSLSVLIAPLSAQMAPEGGSLPFFDARLAGDQPSPAVRQAIMTSRTPAQRDRRAAALESLQRQIPGLRVDDDQFFDTPHFVRSTARLLTDVAAPGATEQDIVREFVSANRDLFEIAPNEVDRARVARSFRTQHNGVEHRSYQQQVNGLDLHGARLKANLTGSGELINIASTMLPRPAQGFAPAAPVVAPVEALQLAMLDAGIQPTQAPQPLAAPAGRSMEQAWSTPDLRGDVAVTSELLYFPLDRVTVHPAWKVIVPEFGVGNTYEVLVDALDGAILWRWNQLHFAAGGTESVSMRVFTGDSPTPGSPGPSAPDGGQQPASVARTLVTLTPGDVAAESPNHWINDGDNETLGNNVDAHTDLDGDNEPDLPRPQGSPFRVFDYALDLDDAPIDYTEAAITNLFYHCNVFHDRLYQLGFDEVAGNFQADNFGLGGVEGDLVQADAQDGSFVNNANFGTDGADGSGARMQMFPWSAPDPDRDGDFDAEIIYHEYSHGLSIRLSEGTVFGEQSGGMGEGWGDFIGLCLLAEPGDDPHAVYGLGGYSTLGLNGEVDNYYFGIRRYPHSTDLSKSPLTYADTDPNQVFFPPGVPKSQHGAPNADQVHNVGEIWCAGLVAARAELWDTLGFAANELILQLVVDGMKLMPDNPNMLQARDAILQADLVNNGGANLTDLWEGFAHRGMGYSATSPSGSTTTGVSEAFDPSLLIAATYPSGTPAQLAPVTPTSFQVDFAASGPNAPLADSGTLFLSTDGGPYEAIPMTDLGGASYEATIPASDCFAELSFYVTLETTGGTFTDPVGGPTSAFQAKVLVDTVIVLDDDFESDLGWTAGAPGDTATTGTWERGDPNGTAAQPEDDFSDDGTQCYVTGLGSPGGSLGADDIDGGFTTLVSPMIDLTGGDAIISYYRWFSNDSSAAPNTEALVVEITDDGSFWVEVETVGPENNGETSGGWFYHEFLAGDLVALTDEVQVRFIAADYPEPEGSLVEAAIDEFRVTRPLCSQCQPDLGFGGPGSSALSLCGDVLDGEGAATLLLENAPANKGTFLLYGVNQNAVAAYGGFIVPLPAIGATALVTDGAGEIALPVNVDLGPATLYLQYVIDDPAQPFGVGISNVVGAEFK